MVAGLRRLRRAVQHLGVDIQRYPTSDLSWGTVQILRHNELRAVLDVGANDGGYAATLRRHGFDGWIFSFEPLPEPFARLARRAAEDPHWLAFNHALGAEEGRVHLNVAGNAGASSSVLPMLPVHQDAEPSSAYVGRQLVQVRMLDTVVSELDLSIDRYFLKLDIQGFEHAALDGAQSLLDAGVIAGVQIELSFVPLYAGGMNWREGIDRLSDYGFTLVQILPGFTDRRSRQMYQADAVFIRTS